MELRRLKPTEPANTAPSQLFFKIYRPPVMRSPLPVLSQENQGSMYHYLGAHREQRDGMQGVRFAVWAPNARQVSVLTDGNGWTPGQDTLYGSDSGVWSGFIPGMPVGATYKFGIHDQWGGYHEKSDPYAFHTEMRPKTASVVWELDNYQWTDDAWLKYRSERDWLHEPVAMYEVHLGSWKKPTDGRPYYTYRELAPMLVDYAHEMGYTHLQLMPVTEYPFDGSWGYQVTGYFAPTSRFGTPDDFMYFVDYCHKSHIGVLLDWVPAHFPKDGHSLGKFDGTACYEHGDPRQGEHPDWGTYVFNYGRTEVKDFLLSSARFWCDKYHIDGIRVDAVASMLYLDYSRKQGEWVPNCFGGRENLEAIQLLKDMNVMLHRDFPGILTVAEESTSWGGVSRPTYTGGLGFSLKWDMGWMNDSLRYIRRDPIYRTHHQNELSFRMIYAYHENFTLPLSHDEVVHGKKSLLSQMPGDYWQQFANLRMLYGYQYTQPGKKLLFMGGEFGQWHEWNYNESLDWNLFGHQYHDGLRRLVGDLNHLYRTTPALYDGDVAPEGFSWIQADDSSNCVYAYIRQTRDHEDALLVALNFTPVPRYNYRLGVPKAGFYQEIINTDAGIYGGGNIGNIGGVYSQKIASHGRDHSIEITLPPLSMLIMKPVAGVEQP